MAGIPSGPPTEQLQDLSLDNAPQEQSTSETRAQPSAQENQTGSNGHAVEQNDTNPEPVVVRRASTATASSQPSNSAAHASETASVAMRSENTHASSAPSESSEDDLPSQGLPNFLHTTNGPPFPTPDRPSLPESRGPDPSALAYRLEAEHARSSNGLVHQARFEEPPRLYHGETPGTSSRRQATTWINRRHGIGANEDAADLTQTGDSIQRPSAQHNGSRNGISTGNAAANSGRVVTLDQAPAQQNPGNGFGNGNDTTHAAEAGSSRRAPPRRWSSITNGTSVGTAAQTSTRAGTSGTSSTRPATASNGAGNGARAASSRVAGEMVVSPTGWTSVRAVIGHSSGAGETSQTATNGGNGDSEPAQGQGANGHIGENAPLVQSQGSDHAQHAPSAEGIQLNGQNQLQLPPAPSSSPQSVVATFNGNGNGNGNSQHDDVSEDPRLDPDWDTLTEEEKFRRDSAYRSRQASLAFPPQNQNNGN